MSPIVYISCTVSGIFFAREFNYHTGTVTRTHDLPHTTQSQPV